MLVATLLAAGGSAAAHAYLESSEPSQSEVLLLAPRQITLHFDEPVEIDFGSIRVFAFDDRRVDQGGTHHPGDDQRAVTVSLPGRLPDGTYVVAWHVISDDSHPVHGVFVFSVGTAAGVAQADVLSNALAAASGSTVVGFVYGVVRFCVFAALLVLVGLTAVVQAVCRSGWRARRLRRVVGASWLVLVVATVASIAMQGVYAATLPIGHLFSPSLFEDVLHTRFGEMQVLRLILLVVAAPVLRAVVRGRAGVTQGRIWTSAALGLGVGLLLTPGLAGHASTNGNAAVGESLDVVHLVGAAVWIGGLTLLGALLVPGVPEAERPAPVPAVARRFSPYAVVAVVAVVASGTVQSLRQVGSLYALFHTVYGRTLVVKLAVVVMLVALGATSRRLVLGRWFRVPEPGRGENGGPSATRRSPAAFARSVLGEGTLVVAVLVATALLVNAAPARQAAAHPFSQSFTVLGDQVNLVVAPARVGTGNQVHVYLLGRLGQPVAVPELDAAIGLSSSGIGRLALPMVLVGPGHYRAANVTFSSAGNWTVRITVHTSAVDEREVSATVPVH